MPDLPSSKPGTYYYPSAAPAKHSKSYFPSEPIHRLEDLGMSQDMMPIQNVHSNWGDIATKMVRARLHTNDRKDRQHLTTPLPPSGREDRDATQQRRGFLHDKLLNADATTLMGGVMTTSLGRDYVSQRLKARVEEYNAMGSQGFTPEEPKQTTKKEMAAADVIYQLLLDINGYLIEGVVDQKIIDLANAVAGRLYSDGNTLSVSDVSRMLDIVYRMERDLRVIISRGYTATRGFEEEAPEVPGMAVNEEGDLEAIGEDVVPPRGVVSRGVRNYLYMLDRVFKRILGILSTLNKYIFATPEDKATLLAALRPAQFERAIKERPETVGDLEPAATLSASIPAPGTGRVPPLLRTMGTNQQRRSAPAPLQTLPLGQANAATIVSRRGRGMTGSGQPFFF